MQFGLELIDVFESVSNIKAFMRMEQGSVEGSLVINGTILSCTWYTALFYLNKPKVNFLIFSASFIFDRYVQILRNPFKCHDDIHHQSLCSSRSYQLVQGSASIRWALRFAWTALAAHQPAPAPKSPIRQRSTSHAPLELSQAQAAAAEETDSLMHIGANCGLGRLLS